MFSKAIYMILKKEIRFALKMYFRKYTVRGQDKISLKTPVIFATNHQNAFLDALLVTCATQVNPFFLARADIFQAKWATSLLNIIRIMPIYRFRDGLGNVKKNVAIIDKCADLLSKKESLVIFPEGDQSFKFTIRPLQKGIARIAFRAESSNDFNLGLTIVPTGIQYEDHFASGKNVLVSFGDPISVNKFRNQFERDNIKALDLLRSEIREQMIKLVVDIRPEEEYDFIFNTWQANRKMNAQPVEQLKLDQEMISRIKSDPGEFSISADKEERSSISVRILMYPVFFFSFLNFIVPHLVVKFVLKKENTHFFGSLRFTLWFVLAPIVLIAQSLLIYMLLGSYMITFSYVIISVIFGILTVRNN